MSYHVNSSEVPVTAIVDDVSSPPLPALESRPMVQAPTPVQVRSKVQKLFSISFIAIYCLVYFTLSSNPKVVFITHDSGDDWTATAHNNKNKYNNNNKNNKAMMGQQPNNHTQFDQEQLREQHVLHVASKLSRVYNPVPPSSWCIDSRLKFDQGKRKPMGLCYLKIPRAASSTLVGVNVRIARNFAARQGLPDSCIRHDGPTPGVYYRQREAGLSFLWTMVRHPSDRALSRVASNLAKQQPVNINNNNEDGSNNTTTNTTTTNDTMAMLDMVPPATNTSSGGEPQQQQRDLVNYTLEALQQSTDVQFGTVSQGRGGFQVQYSMLRVREAYTSWNETEPTKVLHPRLVQQNVQEILNRYDFIGVVERFDESLVALQLLLGLETQDILYFSSRTKDQYTIRKAVQMGRRGRGSRYICQSNYWDPQVLRTDEVEKYLSSPTWWAQNYGDMLLYHAASLSLDQTIIQIGLETFVDALKAFRSMLQLARQHCHPIFPCSTNGTEQFLPSESNCYFDDIGCGYPCLDNVSESLSLVTNHSR